MILIHAHYLAASTRAKDSVQQTERSEKEMAAASVGEYIAKIGYGQGLGHSRCHSRALNCSAVHVGHCPMLNKPSYLSTPVPPATHCSAPCTTDFDGVCSFNRVSTPELLHRAERARKSACPLQRSEASIPRI